MIDLEVDSKTIPDVGLVIFDKDGTLVELYPYCSKIVALRARIICEALGLGSDHEAGLRWALGVDEKAGRMRPEGPVGLKKREVVLKAATDYLDGVGRRNALRLCEEAFDRIDEFSSANLGEFIKPIPGAAALMSALHDCGCRVALATVDLGKRARLVMDFIGASDRVDLIVGGEDVVRPKPDPEMIHIILNRLGIDRSQVVMIGDAITDIQMGISAGVKASVGVLTGFATAEQFRPLTPFIARDVSEIVVSRKDARKLSSIDRHSREGGSLEKTEKTGFPPSRE
jgi:HAD superfamily hydrolase (TIGR01509 family)